MHNKWSHSKYSLLNSKNSPHLLHLSPTLPLSRTLREIWWFLEHLASLFAILFSYSLFRSLTLRLQQPRVLSSILSSLDEYLSFKIFSSINSVMNLVIFFTSSVFVIPLMMIPFLRALCSALIFDLFKCSLFLAFFHEITSYLYKITYRCCNMS